MKEFYMRKLMIAAVLGLVLTLALYLSVPYLSPPSGAVPGTVVRVEVHVLLRISQLDEAQYASPREFAIWSGSSSSAAAMAAVINYYSRTPRRVRITDILPVALVAGAIPPPGGLLDGAGLERCMAHFGMHTSLLQHEAPSRLVALANAGTPVIVGWLPSRYPGELTLVVSGGAHGLVFLTDSSRANRHALSYAQFSHWWAGFAAVVTPPREAQADGRGGEGV
jgi:hypothetical protein